MGNCNSRKSGKVTSRTKTGGSMRSEVNRRRNTDVDLMSDDNDGGDMSRKKFDDAEVAKLKRELEETPQIFVLNNLLMSVMFFESYEKEKNTLKHSGRTALERELNPTLLRDETIECIIPDVLFETVNKNVQFRRRHGPNKHKVEPLIPRRLFVVNDNIEVVESRHIPQYSVIDKPSYQVVVENSTNHEGYVKLKCLPVQPRKILQPDNEPETIKPKPGPSTQSDDSDTYDYTTIGDINTPKPIKITTFERRDTLPKFCFSARKIKKYDKKMDSEDEDDEDWDQPRVKEELFETITYISSIGFMTHFQNGMFPNSLGQSLGFDISDIKLAKSIPGKIFCDLQDANGELSSLPCEIIPSVAIHWPIELTFEFHDRAERPTMWDKFGEKYRWPQANMIKEIRGLSCTLIPRGYLPKRGDNPDKDIEWEVAFPKAQRYLDTHMSETQIRAFLFLMTIYKTYIEANDGKYDGLLVDHIRTHMYWECESNPRDWPEHRLGSKLALVMKSLLNKLAIRELPDFFIKSKNAFSNVPSKHLTRAQRVFHDILESPAIYFIGALRNLRYSNPNFYPQFDFKELYRILTRPSQEFMDPKMLAIQPPQRNRRPISVDGDANYKKEIRWKIRQEKLNRENFLKKKRDQEQKEANLKSERRGSVDSVDYEWQSNSELLNSHFKIRPLLIFFIKHFVDMARRSRRMASQRQALFYLKQATYLCRLLNEFGLEADASELFEIINKEETTSKKLSVSESFKLPPSTPKRNSAQFKLDLLQQVNTKNINLNNLNNTFNNPTMPNNFTKLKKNPSNLKGRTRTEDRRKSGERRHAIGFSDIVEVR